MLSKFYRCVFVTLIAKRLKFMKMKNCHSDSNGPIIFVSPLLFLFWTGMTG